MKVGLLQFNPRLRDLEGNRRKVDDLLESLQAGDLDLLVLPELALTGYNFASYRDIQPYLEPTAAGPTATWARRTAARLQCLVTVGYPEICFESGDSKTDNSVSRAAPSAGDTEDRNGSGRAVDQSDGRSFRTYNSQMTVDQHGALVANYRKTHLYYTDASWSWPNPVGFGERPTDLPLELFSRNRMSKTNDKLRGPVSTPAAFAICMDLNPNRFMADWDDYELATHIKRSGARLLVASNAWLTLKSTEELKRQPDRYDAETLAYWISRLEPLLEDKGEWREQHEPETTAMAAESVHHRAQYQGSPTKPDARFPAVAPPPGARQEERVIIIANRVGIEEGEVRACDLTMNGPPLDCENTDGLHGMEKLQKQVAGERSGEGPTSAEPTALGAAEGESEEAQRTTDAMASEARYAGSSCVFGLRGDGRIRMYGILGRAQEKLLVIDTNEKPAWIGQLRKSTSE